MRSSVLMLSLALLLFVQLSLCVLSVSADDYCQYNIPCTGLINDLQRKIDPCDGDFFGESCGNKGVLFRSPDGYDWSVGGDGRFFFTVPASLITNELYGPTLRYPCGYPFAPESYWYPVVGRITSGDFMANAIPDYDNFQSDDYEAGVFYATDSNSVDGRCRWRGDDGIYDCPNGLVVDTQDDWKVKDYGTDWLHNTNTGSGYYYAGNPYVDPNAGGGTGCHWDDGNQVLDQFNSHERTDPYRSLTQDYDCQCNYDLRGDGSWLEWIETALKGDDQGENQSWQTAWASNGPAPDAGILDWSACWVKNPKDMLALQNTIYTTTDQWLASNGLPASQADWDSQNPDDLRVQYGWNEIPVNENVINDPCNWDTIAISLPAALCWQESDPPEYFTNYGTGDGLWCLDEITNGYNLECQLTDYVYNNWLLPGADNVDADNTCGTGYSISSNIVVMKTQQDNSDYRWKTIFMCENWTSPNGIWQVVYVPPGDPAFPDGACYLDYGPNYQGIDNNLLCIGKDGTKGGDGTQSCDN